MRYLRCEALPHGLRLLHYPGRLVAHVVIAATPPRAPSHRKRKRKTSNAGPIRDTSRKETQKDEKKKKKGPWTWPLLVRRPRPSPHPASKPPVRAACPSADCLSATHTAWRRHRTADELKHSLLRARARSLARPDLLSRVAFAECRLTLISVMRRHGRSTISTVPVLSFVSLSRELDGHIEPREVHLKLCRLFETPMQYTVADR